VNPTGSPLLATAGTGDVLAGLLVSLVAAGVPVEMAALAAAYVHGLAARHAAAMPLANQIAEPVTAPDVAESLPIVIGSL
jgi:NAD(P)H-hydrate repair Nnr-like enzyme with NAD(P)H-hydrate dehydratase domain